MSLTTFRHFATSARVLSLYTQPGIAFEQQAVLAKHVKEAVRLALRTEDVCLPDHQHRNRTEYAFDESATIAEMLLAAMHLKPASSFWAGGSTQSGSPYGLEVRHGSLYVQSAYMEDWQREVVAYQSPVPLLAAAWLCHSQTTKIPEEETLARLLETLRYSTLPGVHDNRLHGLIQNEEHNAGRLCDLHVHINGTTEFAHVWGYSLQNLQQTRFALENVYKNEKVQYFYKQLDTSLYEVCNRLEKAAILRQWICRVIQSLRSAPHIERDSKKITTPKKYEKNFSVLPPEAPFLFSWEYLEQMMLYPLRSSPSGTWQHPFQPANFPLNCSSVQQEGAMWLYALATLQQTKNEFLAVLLHSYMLFMHQHLRLLVQQQDQYGFDQFQYITLAGAREACEAWKKPGFSQRFKQFHGMYGPDLAHIEARFAPKDNPIDTARFLLRIWQGHKKAAGNGKGTPPVPCNGCPQLRARFYMHNGKPVHTPQAKAIKQGPTLGLLAHFIKEKDTKKGNCRHAKLRDACIRKARALVETQKMLSCSYPELAKAIVGKDAASNELETPPEVFAKTFRYLNNKGITCTTYHAGEDFEHLLSGIRAVHEAIVFLDMSSGDRIGHATALGLDPKMISNEVVRCPQGKWLDDLIWLTWYIHSTPSLASKHAAEVARWHSDITRLYRTIYEKRCPSMPVLWKGWRLRAFDVRMLFNIPSLRSAEEQADYEAFAREALEKQNITEEDIITLQTYLKNSTQNINSSESDKKNFFADAIKELQLYHSQSCYKRWEKVMVIKPEHMPANHLLRDVQDALILEMRKKNILVEVLPTSNVRISYYEKTEEHHVMRWLNPNDPRPAPQVVLGTDDPGIFSTNLRNEYTFILHKLQTLHPEWSEKPYEILRHLIDNGRSYSFKR